MLPLLALFLLIGPSVCTSAGDREELAFGADAESWVTVNLKGIPVPSIELQLQDLKRSRTHQFYGLMGKRVEGAHPIQSTERVGYQLGRILQDLLGTRGLSIEGSCRRKTNHQSAGPGAVARESVQSQRGRSDSTEEDSQSSETAPRDASQMMPHPSLP